MTTIWNKLNLKQLQQVLVINAPASFESELALLDGIEVMRAIEGVRAIEFILAFVTKQAEVNTLSQSIAPKAKGDTLVWFA